MKRCIFFMWILTIHSALLFAQISPAFYAAKTAFEDGFYPRAYDGFTTFLHQNPTDALSPEAAYYQAESLFRQGNIAESMPLFERINERFIGHPLGTKALLRLVQFDLDNGAWQRAITTSNQVLQQANLEEEAAMALFMQAKAHYGLKNDVRALQSISELINQFPKTDAAPRALYFRGNLLERVNQKDAIQSYLDVLEDYTQHPIATDAAIRLFQFYYDTKQYDTLINRSSLLLRFVPTTSKDKTTMLLADVCLRENRLAEAERYYNELSFNGTAALADEAKFGLGQVAMKQEKWDRAALFFSELHLDMNHSLAAQALYFEALAYNRKGDTRKALQSYYLLSQADNIPQYLLKQALKEGGYLAYQVQNYDQAATFLVQYLEREITLTDAQEGFLLAESYLQLDDKESALLLWKSLFELPDNEVKYQSGMRLAAHAEVMKRFTEAQIYYEKLKELDGKPDVLVKLSEVQRQLNNIDGAKRTLQQLNQRFPNSAEAKMSPYLLGWLDFESKNYEGAARYFERYLEYRRNSADDVFKTDAVLRLGDAYYALRKFDQAATTYRSAGESGEAYGAFQSAKALQAARKFEEALQAYQQFIPEHPRSEWVPDAWYQIGNLHLLDKRNLEAIAAFAQITKNHATAEIAPKALYGIGSAAFNLQDYEQSFTAYKTILERYPNSDLAKEAVDALQESALMLEKPELAERFLQSFLLENPTSALGGESRLKTAEYYFNNQNYAEALPRFDAFIRINRQPELLPQALNLAAQSAIQLQKYAQAQEYLQILLAINPQNDEYRTLLVDFYKSQNQNEAAIKLLLEVADEKRNYWQEADLYLRLNQFTEARIALDKCIAGFDVAMQFDCKLLEGELLAQQTLFKEASEVFRYLAGLGDEPKLAQAQFRYADMLFELGKTLEARSAYAIIPDRFPDAQNWVEKSYVAQAKCYLKLDQPEEAKQACQILKDYYPNTTLSCIE